MNRAVAGTWETTPPLREAASARARGERGRMALALAALLAGTALVYGGALFAGFVWDDASVVLPTAARSPAAALRQALTRGVAVEDLALGYFRPLVDMSYALDGWLWGGRPFGFHLTNVLLYGLCVVLAYRLARRFLGSEVGGVAAAGAFAVHPVHVESVAWVQGRGDLLAFLGVAAALLAFLRSLRAPRTWPWRLAAGTAMLLGLLAKEWAVATPLLACAWWFLVVRREEGSGLPQASPAPAPGPAAPRHPSRMGLCGLLAALAPFAAALALYAALRLPAEAGSEAHLAPALLTTAERWLVVGPTFARYVRLLLWPHPLSAYHVVPVPAGAADRAVVGGVLLWATLAAGAVWAARRAPRAAFALWWFLLTVALVLPVMPIKGFTLAERYLFLPSFGFALGLGLLAARLWRAASGRALRCALGVGGAALALVWAAAAAARVPDWVEQITFHRAMVRSAPDSAFAHNNLGQLLVAEGRVDEGVRHLERAVALRPDMAYAHAGLGLARWRQGDLPRAVAALETAARLRPIDPRILADLAAALQAQDRTREAVLILHRLESLRPGSPEVARRLAGAYAALGDRARAEHYAVLADRASGKVSGPGSVER